MAGDWGGARSARIARGLGSWGVGGGALEDAAAENEDCRLVVTTDVVFHEGNWDILLLCSLLIGNTLVNVVLTIVTDPIWLWMFGFAGPTLSVRMMIPSRLVDVLDTIKCAYIGDAVSCRV